MKSAASLDSAMLLYISNYKLTFYMLPFVIASRNITFLGINLKKSARSLHRNIYNIIKKTFKGLNKVKDISSS